MSSYKCEECGGQVPFDRDNGNVILTYDHNESDKMYADRMGRYWLLVSDTKEFQKWRDDGVLCLKCFEKFKWEIAPDPTCSQCHYSYPRIFHHQANCCAAYMSSIPATGEYVYACYGSAFDQDRFDFTVLRTIPFKRNSAICDLCIIQLLLDGTLKDADEYQGNNQQHIHETAQSVHAQIGEHLRTQLFPMLSIALLPELNNLVAKYVF